MFSFNRFDLTKFLTVSWLSSTCPIQKVTE